jgi:hypothetical protein
MPIVTNSSNYRPSCKRIIPWWVRRGIEFHLQKHVRLSFYLCDGGLLPTGSRLLSSDFIHQYYSIPMNFVITMHASPQACKLIKLHLLLKVVVIIEEVFEICSLG